jgi:hypothetical protein
MNTTAIGYRDYFYNTFPQELRQFSESRVPKGNCTHCRAPLHRRCLVNRRELNNLSAKARFCWYAITLVDQGLFRYFPNNSDTWIRATGGYPLPVEYSGMGCVRVVPPGYLLKTHDSLELWNGFVEFWLEEMKLNFEEYTGIKPSDFFSKILNDRDIQALENARIFEESLFSRATNTVWD